VRILVDTLANQALAPLGKLTFTKRDDQPALSAAVDNVNAQLQWLADNIKVRSQLALGGETGGEGGGAWKGSGMGGWGGSVRQGAGWALRLPLVGGGQR
jgi:hypothetical protein